MISLDSLSTSGIEDSLRSRRKDLDKLGVKTLSIFGSVARNEASPNSDIDFLVTFNADMKNFDNYINLLFLLEELFNRRIDLLTSDSISGEIKNSIERESILIEI